MAMEVLWVGETPDKHFKEVWENKLFFMIFSTGEVHVLILVQNTFCWLFTNQLPSEILWFYIVYLFLIKQKYLVW